MAIPLSDGGIGFKRLLTVLVLSTPRWVTVHPRDYGQGPSLELDRQSNKYRPDDLEIHKLAPLDVRTAPQHR
jgi:hypothetical protein